MTKNILFRADSSSQIGMGHIMRDLVLASQLQKEFSLVPEQSDKYPWGAEICFATQDLSGNINHKITEAGYENIELKTNNKEELLELLKAWHVNLLVIDHYAIDYNYESYIKENYDVQILVFDDMYERHNCDILLNHNISAKKKKYRKLVPKNCELRCGSKYTLIRDEFKKVTINKRTIKNKKILTAFIAMGGSDSQNVNMKIMKVLSKFENIHMNVATTSSNMNIKKLIKFASKSKNINIYIDSKKIAYLMNKADFAIISPSVISAEVLYMELPFIAIKTADNQNDICDFLVAKNFFVLDSFNAKKLASYIKKICEPKQYNKIKNRIKSIKLTKK